MNLHFTALFNRPQIDDARHIFGPATDSTQSSIVCFMLLDIETIITFLVQEMLGKISPAWHLVNLF